MDTIILFVGIAFMSLIALALVFFLKEPQDQKQKLAQDASAKKSGPSWTIAPKIPTDIWSLSNFLKFFFPKKQTIPQASEPVPTDSIASLKKRLSVQEEKIKKLEEDLKNTQNELVAAEKREQDLLEGRKTIAFDSEQYEKFKKDYRDLKTELAKKEEMLENEISKQRQLTTQLLVLGRDNETLKKKLAETDDAYRKSQTQLELLTQELKTTKQTVDEQKKIVSEHATSKIEGEWVSRIEFDKLEKELKEKEIMIQKMLSVKKEP